MARRGLTGADGEQLRVYSTVDRDKGLTFCPTKGCEPVALHESARLPGSLLRLKDPKAVACGERSVFG